MKLENVTIENYKGLLSTSSPLSNFVCAIGENNSGKSSLLQTLLLFINGSKLTTTEFYNPTKDILITVELSGIDDAVLLNTAEEHRGRIKELINNGKITLARRYSTDGTSKLRVVKDVPRDSKYSEENVNTALAGKKGNQIVDAIKAFYPEIGNKDAIEGLSTQKAAKELIQKHIDSMTKDQLIASDVPLPTGIDNSFRALLPEPIYIPAVKDLSDDLKTKESTSFGKLLNILLNVIEDDLVEEKATFETIRKKLNRIVNQDGIKQDERMDKVIATEAAIQTNLSETFKNVAIELEIPPPVIKSILSNATIIADDGVRGPIDNKGDGFKRAITFSILRTYVQLSQNVEWRKKTDKQQASKDKFLFLFEEPELYLHPKAQNILYDALSLISKNHQVIVTTHSPLFFSANNTTTFIKMAKRQTADKPVGICHSLSLENMSEKDKFQLISFESSNAAFFANKILLVEGDSDFIALPHIAKLLDETWNFKAASIDIIRVTGKGSFKRYKDFFSRCDVRVLMVTDLDILLQDFDKVEPSAHAIQLRNELITQVDSVIDAENRMVTPNHRLLSEELQRDRVRKIFEKILEARSRKDVDAQVSALGELFVFERTNPRLEVLKDQTRHEILQSKRTLLAELRNTGVYVLEKGTIEDYFPTTVAGTDKPSKAQSFCQTISTHEAAIHLSSEISVNGKTVTEFEVIFGGIFSQTQLAQETIQPVMAANAS